MKNIQPNLAGTNKSLLQRTSYHPDPDHYGILDGATPVICYNA